MRPQTSDITKLAAFFFRSNVCPFVCYNVFVFLFPKREISLMQPASSD